MHESFEAPAAIEIWANNKNHNISYTRVYENEELPDKVNDFNFLIVMGGPQSPATTLKECPHFNTKKEIALIKMAIDSDKAVLGVCLGAQLIGEALGAKFEHSPNREIGVFELTLTDTAQKDPIFSTFPDKFQIGHWHGDMPGLTNNSEILAFNEGCPRQVVKYTPKVYGFQCHFEFTQEAIEGMIENNAHELEKYKSLPYIEDADTLRNHDYNKINKKLFRFLDYIESLFNQNE